MRYVIAYTDKQGRSEWRMAKVVDAKNAKDARKLFDAWHGAQNVDCLSVIVRVSVARYDGLIRCPLCRSLLEEPNDREIKYACTNVPTCGLRINRKA